MIRYIKKLQKIKKSYIDNNATELKSYIQIAIVKIINCIYFENINNIINYENIP